MVNYSEITNKVNNTIFPNLTTLFHGGDAPPLPYNLNSLFIFNEYGLIGGICSCIAIIIATHQILMHLYFFNEPKLQLYIVRILLMVPVYNILILDILNSIVAFVGYSKLFGWS